MKRIIAVFCTVAIIFSAILTRNIFAASDNINQITLPSVSKLKEKQHYNDLIKLQYNKDEFDKYLNNLNDSDLLLTISEFSDELSKTGEIENMSYFNDIFDKKLLNKLKDSDYITVLNNTEYSDAFRMYMMDMSKYSKMKNNTKNSADYNKTLRNIIKDKNATSDVKSFALTRIDDLNNNDSDMLNSLISSSNSNSDLKALALELYRKMDEKSAYGIINNIVKNYSNYSTKEVVNSIRLLLNTSQDTVQLLNEADNRIDDVDKILQASKDQSMIHGIVFALGDYKNDKSVKEVIKNRNIINEDGLIRYYVDMNYHSVENMLDASNDTDTINTALTCVEIAPFKSFLPKLNSLIANCNDNSITDRAKALVDVINQGTLDRNIKWDSK